ncbi:biotin-dependent carboxyltransferase family protein [Guptibacillus algicola]|uniref:5-oxoprolinase subunit C family protein n=1 Tax=Guptibacillus algicola TaxID=225844 RepID=UPI001CD447D6|nr:biotin-dependent carboxyltransferase family protein [Alkalihalobacillus algicola]MCA0988532.1 biotin-dependent carboxyltransferase family protein [Alkalihalobacillus algicola]
MSNDLFKVKKPGLLTTIQDHGRVGYQQYGIVVAGAMDSFSMNISNFLVGNKGDEAVLEVTVMGPKLEVLGDAIIAICGGNLSPTVNGKNVPMWKSFEVNAGDRLEFGQPVEGARSYISVAGGFDIPIVMGSKSTYLKAGIGGFEGRALERGDVLKSARNAKGKRGRALHYDEVPTYEKEITIRVVMGPHLHAFTDEAVETFLSSTYEVTPKSDRMGYRVTGPTLEHETSADIISEAIPLGGIQVPANGEPIILMSDRQTTGGYTRIATVISNDISSLAQAMPGCKIRFQEVSVEEAQEIYERNDRFIRTLEKVSG